MPLVWEQLQKLGLSPDTIDILMASWEKIHQETVRNLPLSMGDLL